MTWFQLQCLIVGCLLMWLQRGALIQMRDFVTAMSVVFAILCLLILTGGRNGFMISGPDLYLSFFDDRGLPALASLSVLQSDGTTKDWAVPMRLRVPFAGIGVWTCLVAAGCLMLQNLRFSEVQKSSILSIVTAFSPGLVLVWCVISRSLFFERGDFQSNIERFEIEPIQELTLASGPIETPIEQGWIFICFFCALALLSALSPLVVKAARNRDHQPDRWIGTLGALSILPSSLFLMLDAAEQPVVYGLSFLWTFCGLLSAWSVFEENESNRFWVGFAFVSMSVMTGMVA